MGGFASFDCKNAFTIKRKEELKNRAEFIQWGLESKSMTFLVLKAAAACSAVAHYKSPAEQEARQMGQCHWVSSQLLGKQCLMLISWTFLVFWHEVSPSFISRGQYLTAPVQSAASRSSLLRSPPLNPIFHSLASSTSQLRFVAYNHFLEMQGILSWMASAFTKASDVSSCQFHHAQLKKKSLPDLKY